MFSGSSENRFPIAYPWEWAMPHKHDYGALLKGGIGVRYQVVVVNSDNDTIFP